MEILAAVEKNRISQVTKLSNQEQLCGLFASSKYPKRRVIDSIRLMSHQGFVSLGQLDNEQIVKITKKGQRKLNYYRLVAEGLDHFDNWDKNWYLVTFDIPESHKVARNKFILLLKECGFVSYSKGIWITPYNKSSFIKKITNHLGLTNFVRSIVASQIDKSSQFKKRFQL